MHPKEVNAKKNKKMGTNFRLKTVFTFFGAFCHSDRDIDMDRETDRDRDMDRDMERNMEGDMDRDMDRDMDPD
jgi:zinc finger CCCH domain-containing protein 13